MLNEEETKAKKEKVRKHFSTEDIKMTSFSLDYFQEHEPQLFRFWSTLTKDQQGTLEHQLKQINFSLLQQQKQLIKETPNFTSSAFNTFENFACSGDVQDEQQGRMLIEQGRLGCLLLAGGQGTRLNYSGPKGTYPISVIKHKSLFQLCVEKVRAASQWAHHPLNLAIMTSPNNDDETRIFFHQHDYFGLSPTQVFFFVQDTLPFLDAKGQLFLKTPWEISIGADGNGHSLLCFAQSDIWKTWREQGIDYVHVILVDNPLADPFDAELLGFHYRQQNEITLKCTEKLQADEKVGVLVEKNNRCTVIEYSEIPDHEKQERRLDGRLKHCCANLSLFCFSMSFIQRLIDKQLYLPFHKAWKAAYYVDEQGISKLSNYPIAWKFETFIFDWLMYTQKISALLYPREQCFAPLKNLKGWDSPETVRTSLQQADRRTIQAVTGLPVPNFPFELAADFYYPTLSLQSKWNGKLITDSYVEP